MIGFKNQWTVVEQINGENGGYKIVLQCEETNINKITSDIALLLASGCTSCRQLLTDCIHLSKIELTFTLKIQSNRFLMDLKNWLPDDRKEPALIEVN